MYNHLHGYKCLVLITTWILLLVPYSTLKVKAENNANIKYGSSAQLLKGIVSQNELVDNLERLGIKCTLHQTSASAATGALAVEKVRLGSAAYYGGVLHDDVVKNLYQLNNNTFVLAIERSGQIYQLKIQTLTGQLIKNSQFGATVKNDLLKSDVARQESKTITDNKRNAIATAIGKTAITDSINPPNNKIAQKLLPYDIRLIIDVSGSMNQVDGTGNLTKFQWCHKQVSNLAQQLAKYNKTIAITTFNASHQTIEGCTPETIEQIFTTIEPNGGTDLVDPLLESLNNSLAKYQQNNRPTLIVVITDGLPNIPNDPTVVNRALIDFIQRLSKPDEVLVTILQIGDAFEGADFCIDLDDNLVNEGAKYDIVDTKTFAELKQQGLVQAMISAIIEAGNSKQISPKAKRIKRLMNSLPLTTNQTLNKIDNELRNRQNQRQEIERQILRQ